MTVHSQVGSLGEDQPAVVDASGAEIAITIQTRERAHGSSVIQVWVQVRYADGTSPGWLLLDDEKQVTVTSRYW